MPTNDPSSFYYRKLEENTISQKYTGAIFVFALLKIQYNIAGGSGADAETVCQ
ncbi:hypothetical protein [Lentibacillus amyloliquefaciens]|nr:hypothetical protein [Lentibacillus amyloliquefaciens]